MIRYVYNNTSRAVDLRQQFFIYHLHSSSAKMVEMIYIHGTNHFVQECNARICMTHHYFRQMVTLNSFICTYISLSISLCGTKKECQKLVLKDLKDLHSKYYISIIYIYNPFGSHCRNNSS